MSASRFPISRAASGSLRALACMLRARFNEDRCLQVAGSLTFTTLLSLAPFVTVTLMLISVFPVFKDLSAHLHSFLMENIVPESVDAIAAYAGQFAENAGRLTAVGIVFLSVTAIMLLLTIENAFNQIWRVTRPRPLLRRILVYSIVLAVGPVLIGASLSLTSWLVSLSLGLVSAVPGMAVVVLKIVPVMLTSLAFAVVYLAMPNRQIRTADAFVGGIAAGVGFEAMKQGFAYYITHFATYQLVYGTFATVPIFLLWIYLSWLILIAGAVFVAVLPEWRAGAWRARTEPGSDFFAALTLFRSLRGAYRCGGVVPLAVLCAESGLPADRAERLLEAMAGVKWVARAGSHGWVERRDAAAIKLAEIYHLFVFAPTVTAHVAEPGLGALARALAERIEITLDMTVEEFLAVSEKPIERTPPAPARGA